MKKLLLVLIPLFLIACGDDKGRGRQGDFGTTPQDNCLLTGNPQYCNSGFNYNGQWYNWGTNYPISGNYWQGYYNGGYNNLGYCPYGFPAANPRFGLHCVPNNFHNNRYINTSFYGYNRPISCRINSHCTRYNPNSYCNGRPNQTGICVRR